MTSDFFAKVNELRGIIATAKPSSAALFTLLKIAEDDPDLLRVLWGLLTSPDWLKPLVAAKMFESPPQRQELPGGRYRFVNWEPSKYLVSVASELPLDAAQVLSQIVTNNAAIVADVVDAANRMPANIAASLVPAIARAARQGSLWFSMDEAVKLAISLAKGSELDAAKSLVEALYTPKKSISPSDEHRNIEFLPGLEELIPAMCEIDPRWYLVFLSDLTVAAMNNGGWIISDDDSSVSWRPAIENHQQNFGHDAASQLVDILRDTADCIAAKGQLGDDDVLGILGRYSFSIFARLRLYLVTKHYAKEGSHILTSAILSRSNLEDYRLQHEYGRLLSAHFGRLATKDQDTWLAWVQEGPRNASEAEDTSPSQNELFLLHWKYRRLQWVRAFLGGQVLEDFAAIQRTVGGKEPDEFPFAALVEVQNSSTRSFEGMTFTEVISLLRSELPATGGEDNIRAFDEYLSAHASSLSAYAADVQSLGPPFVRRFLDKMTSAVERGEELDIGSLLQLCEWVVRMPVNSEQSLIPQSIAVIKMDWRWAREAVVSLLTAFAKSAGERLDNSTMVRYTERVVPLLQKLSREQVGGYSSPQEPESDSFLTDYLQRAINSPRGRAVEAVLEFARWRGRLVAGKTLGGSNLPGGFGGMEWVQAEIEWHMDAANRSVEALAIIGTRLGLLHWIDRAWLQSVAETLFPLTRTTDDHEGRLDWAAWNTFLVWGKPHRLLLEILHTQYSRTVDVLSHDGHTRKLGASETSRKLAEHLVLLYGRGDLDATANGSVISKLTIATPVEVRRHALGFVGRTIGKDKLPQEVVARFQRLWTMYWTEGPGKSDARGSPEEWMFGAWFVSRQFPRKWSIEMLESYSSVVGRPEPSEEVAEVLIDFASEFPLKTLLILRSMVREGDGWSIRGWLDSAQKITQTAIRKSADVNALAVEIVNLLGRRGFMVAEKWI